MFKHHIFLCGFMGVGKSTVGKVLSERLELPFIDTDRNVVELAGKPIPRIFVEDGEAEFRAIERRALENLSTNATSVVALGGGTLSAPTNLDFVRRNGILVYLSASLENLSARLSETAESRPLLAGLSDETRRKRIEHLMQTRETVYQQADHQVDTDDRQIGEIVEQILVHFRRRMQ